MPASPEHSPFIPPIPSPYGGSRRVVPTPIPDEESQRGDMHRPHSQGRRSAGWNTPHEGWTPPPGLTWGAPGLGWAPPPAPPMSYGGRPPGHTPGHPPHMMYGTSPWPGYPPPSVHGPSYNSAPYIPGPLPQGNSYGPTPYQSYHAMHPTPRSGSHGYQVPWPHGGTPSGGLPVLDYDPLGFGLAPGPRPDEGMIRVDKWAQGPNYGPVLTPFQIAVLDVKLHINPLLAPSTLSGDQPYLIYNLLFPVGRARRSTDAQSRSWSTGRLTPATWPRVTKLNIISRDFPWVFEIEAARAERGVTCLDVMDGLHVKLQSVVPRHQIDALTGSKGETHRRKLFEAYHYNRSTAHDAPGGFLGEGIRKCDWLLNRVMFDGIIDDPAFVQEKLGIKGRGWNGLKKDKKDAKDAKDAKETVKDRVQGWPATVVLKLDVRYSESEADRASVASEGTEATDETQTQVSEDT